MRTIILLLASSAALWGQGFFTSTASHIRNGATLPATCSVTSGDVFFKTSATVATYYCSSANNWTTIGAGVAAVTTTASATFGAFTYDFSGAAAVSLTPVFVRTDTAFTMTAGKSGIFTPAAAFPSVQLIAGANPTGNWPGALNIDNSGRFNYSPSNAVWSTLDIASGKVAKFNNTITFAGTDSTTMTFPTTTATIARTDAANTFTGVQTMTSPALTTPVITIGSDATGDIYYRDSGGLFKRLAVGGANTLLHGGTIPAYAAVAGADMTNGTVASTQLATANKTSIRSMWLDTPVSGDSYRLMFEEGKAITLTRVACNVIGGTNAVINLRKTTEATSGSAGTAALTSNLTCTAGALVASTTFSSAGVAARIPVALEIVSMSGTNTDLHVFIEYTVD